MPISTEQAATFEAALWGSFNGRDDAERTQAQRELVALLPALVESSDTARLLGALRPPLAEPVADALREVVRPAVAGLLDVAADRSDPTRREAVRALVEMYSWAALPGLDGALAASGNAREKRLTERLRRYHEKTKTHASGRVLKEYRRRFLVEFFGGCCLPWVLVPLAAVLVVLAVVVT